MKQYRLGDPPAGEPQGPAAPLQGQVSLLSPQEFAGWAAELPQGEKLVRSLQSAAYCQVENFLGSTQGIIRTPRRQMAFGFYLRPEYLLLVPVAGQLQPVLEQVHPAVPAGCSPSRFLLLLLEQLLGSDLPHFQQLWEQFSALEESLLRQEEQQPYQRIIGYRKQLNAYHAYYEQLGDVGEQMQESACLQMEAEELRGWQLYANRADRLHNHAEMLREYLLQIRELYQSQIELRQNRIMALLTVVTTIFLPLTLITGWYGMNFPNMLALRWKYGYLVVILLGAAIVALEIFYFKRKKML